MYVNVIYMTKSTISHLPPNCYETPMDQPIKPPPAFCAPPTDEHQQLLLELGMTPDSAQAVIDIDTYMGDMRRSMARKELGRLALRDLQLGIDITDLEIISMIEHGPGPDGEVTV